MKFQTWMVGREYSIAIFGTMVFITQLSLYTTTFAVIMYFMPAFISLITLYFFKKKLVWLAVPITALFDIIAFWDVIMYCESQMLSMVFVIPQLFVVGAISFFIIWRYSRKKNHNLKESDC